MQQHRASCIHKPEPTANRRRSPELPVAVEHKRNHLDLCSSCRHVTYIYRSSPYHENLLQTSDNISVEWRKLHGCLKQHPDHREQCHCRNHFSSTDNLLRRNAGWTYRYAANRYGNALLSVAKQSGQFDLYGNFRGYRSELSAGSADGKYMVQACNHLYNCR